MLIDLNDTNFEQTLARGVVIVDFWASWCGPCKMISPVLEEFASEHPEIAVGKINVDDYPDIAGQFGVLSIPTLLFFKDGKLMDTSIGVISKAVLKNKANALIQ